MTSEEKAFLATATFEGAGYSHVSGSFDKMGFSFGIIQFNYGSGTLQPLITAMYNAGPQTFSRCCSVYVQQYDKTVDLTNDLLATARMSNAQAVAWATARQVKGVPLEHWRKVFYNLGNEPGFQAVQRHFAGSYMDHAKNYMGVFGFESERALALLYDICVQCGSITSKSMGRYRDNVDDSMSEQDKLIVLARAVAPQGGDWAQDVLSRKMTIAKGNGEVHETYYDVSRDFGITDDPVS